MQGVGDGDPWGRLGRRGRIRCPQTLGPRQSRDVQMGEGRKGREFELSTSGWRPGRSGCNMTWARGQNLWAKVTLPPANGVARLGGHRVGKAPWQSAPELRSLWGGRYRSVASAAPKGRRRRGGRGIFAQRKDQGRPIPLSPLLFSVDNLSWPLRCRELCSRALGQDPGSRPPLGRGRGEGTGCGLRALRRAK